MDPLPDATPDATPEYEFNESQNRILQRLAQEMRWVALGFSLLGLLYLVQTVAMIPSALKFSSLWLPALMLGIVTTFLVCIGTWTSKASASLKNVVSSQGNDIQHLMQAMDNLRKKYSVLGFVIKLYLVFVILALIGALLYSFGGK